LIDSSSPGKLNPLNTGIASPNGMTEDKNSFLLIVEINEYWVLPAGLPAGVLGIGYWDTRAAYRTTVNGQRTTNNC
jgi:hypothetical protein